MMPKRRGAALGGLDSPNLFGAPKPPQYGLEVGAPQIEPDSQEEMFAMGGAHPDVAKLTHILGFLGRGPEEDMAQVPGQSDFLLEHAFGGQEPVGPPPTLDQDFGFTPVPPGALGPNMLAQSGGAPVPPDEWKRLTSGPLSESGPASYSPMGGTRLDLAKRGNEKDLMWANFMLENGFV